ncbi:MAG: capsule biosynthesis protein [Pararhodobacter sp.]
MTPATPANTPPPGTGTIAANAGLADEDADDKDADQAERARLLRQAERAPQSALHDRAAASGASAAGNPSGRPAAAQAAPHSADVEGAASTNAEIEAIRSEGLSARQLRMAMRVAQRHGIKATSGLEALRLLRKRGIDPFERSALLDAVQGQPAPTAAAATDPAKSDTSRALTTTEQPPLPRTFRQPAPPAQAEPDAGSKAVSRRQAEIAKIQRDIASRRRRRLALLAARLMVFVLLPTFLAGWYFYRVATPLYATHTDFVIQQADASNAGPPGLGGLFSGTGLATSQDSVTVQSYLQSREAMRRLDAEEGFKAHFQDTRIDPLRRLAMDASDEAAYRLYSRHVQISYDPTEGVVRMEVIAADPETSERFARALIRYAEEQVDRLTQRLRENQMRDAQASFERAEERTVEAQMRVLEMQERFQVLSSEVEVSLLTQQITTLEGQLNQERLSLEDLLANPRPNAARVAQAERRIAALEGQVTALRGSLTQGGAGSASLARVQREMIMAEADVQTRQLLLAQSLQQLEAARIEAARQVRYLSMGVSPIAPDEATYPRRFENTALAFLIFAGVYLMISMTVSILREQVTS